ncbi:putative membrane protein [Kushneria sinocarnis]|uniref:Putative membrane protein n=1 Tax=Kushneria sinocarnis TaxID=595502 RepID=A0A420WX34_9GAMM|nr:hypothetical protein [Kushneria sinocarnis]RKR04284.1 putative membrane protein [Kushneria sinocarnis]
MPETYEQQGAHRHGNVPDQAHQRIMARIVYLLYLVSLVALITGVIGAVMAWWYRRQCREQWLDDHFRFQIRTFWIGALYTLASVVISLIPPFNLLAGLALFLWFAVRAIRGWISLERQRAPEAIDSWLW